MPKGGSTSIPETTHSQQHDERLVNQPRFRLIWKQRLPNVGRAWISLFATAMETLAIETLATQQQPKLFLLFSFL